LWSATIRSVPFLWATVLISYNIDQMKFDHLQFRSVTTFICWNSTTYNFDQLQLLSVEIRSVTFWWVEIRPVTFWWVEIRPVPFLWVTVLISYNFDQLLSWSIAIWSVIISISYFLDQLKYDTVTFQVEIRSVTIR
jgi:hypothetical protein